MRGELEKLLLEAGEPPKGFVKLPSPLGELLLLQSKRGALIGILIIGGFMSLWLFGWTEGCVFLFKQLLKDFSFGFLCFSLVFFAIWLLAASSTAFALFGRSWIRVSEDSVEGTASLFGLRWTSRASRADVLKLKRRRDHNGPSEILEIHVKGRAKPLSFNGLGSEEAAWLEKLLRHWAALPETPEGKPPDLLWETKSNCFDALEIPSLFQRFPSDESALILEQKGSANGPRYFLLLWLAGWTAACVFLVHEALSKRSDIGLWAMAAVFWFFELLVVCSATWLFFGRTLLSLDKEELWLQKSMFGIKRQKSLRREAISLVSLDSFGGGSEDSAPHWRLSVAEREGGRKIVLLDGQPYEASYWLGETVARWSGASFNASPES